MSTNEKFNILGISDEEIDQVRKQGQEEIDQRTIDEGEKPKVKKSTINKLLNMNIDNKNF